MVMADGKVTIETDLDSSGIEKGLSKIGGIAAKGLKVATTTIAGVGAALGGVAAAAVKAGSVFEYSMSNVAAISGATGKDLEALTDKAKEMGKKTKFSASESAEAFGYMAMAGWKTSDMLDGIEGVMNLAAASGENLAVTSDIVTDALTAFGLSAKDSTHFADVLAAASSNANTNVGMMGETFKYVAPVAGALGFSAEDCAVAIGLMANSGIKAGQAGTSLRSIFTRLSDPTNEVQAAMDDLGISVTNSDGSMRSLNDIMLDLRGGFANLTDAEKAQMAATIGGQEAMSGLLAIVNASDGDFEKLRDSIYECDGAAADMAETMQDNLSGKLTILKSGLEGFGVAVYENIADSMKDAAVAATESVDRITDALESGGIDEAVSAAGDEFANLAVEVAEHAPDMVDAAVDFIESFASGIIRNKGRLFHAAGDVAEAITGGLAKLLPSKMQKPVDTAIKAISKSLNSGGLKSAGKTFVNTFDNAISVVGELAKVALPPLVKAVDLLADNMNVIIPVMVSGKAAFKAYDITMKAVSATTKANAAATAALIAMEKANTLQLVASNGGLTMRQMIMGVYNGQITITTALTGLWAKTQSLLNGVMNANPIGLLITLIGSLAAALGMSVLMTDKEAESTERLTDKQKERISASKETIESIEQEAEARQKNLAAATTEIDSAQALWSELSRIVDANGKVKDGYEARAKYITGELANALGIEIGLVDGVVTNYQELETSIYDVITAKKAQAVLDVMESDYAAAMKEQADKASVLADTYGKLNEKKAELAELEAELAVEAENVTVGHTLTGDAVEYHSERYKELKNQLKSSAGELEALQAEFDSANAAMQDNQKVISDYGMLTEAVMSGSTDQINSALAKIQSGIDTTLQAGSEAAVKQAGEVADQLVNILQGEKDGLYQLQDQTKSSLIESLGIALNQVGSGAEEMEQVLASAGKDGAELLVSAMEEAEISGTLSVEARAGMESFISGLREKKGEVSSTSAEISETMNTQLGSADTLATGTKKASEYNAGIGSNKNNIDKTSKDIADSSNQKLGSADTKGTGSKKASEYDNGVKSQKGNIDKTSKDIADSSNQKLGSADTRGTGTRKGSEYNAGVGSNKGNIDATSKNIADSSDRYLGSANTGGTGSRKSGEYNSGLGSNSGVIDSTARFLSEVADSGMGSANTAGTGYAQGSQYASGVGSAYGESESNGRMLADSADAGASYLDGYRAGSNFGAGFVNGISSWLSNASNAGWNLANAAYNAAKRALDEHSPSRKTREVGKFFGEGLALGIEDETKVVQKASKSLADTAVSSLDMTDISLRMREAMAVNTGRVTKSFALESNASILNHSEIDNMMHLSDEDIIKLAKIFGSTAGKTVSDSMEGMAFKVREREFGRLVKGVGKV